MIFIPLAIAMDQLWNLGFDDANGDTESGDD